MDKIGIVVAMEEEKDAVKNLMKDIELEESYELDFYKGKIENKKCILVQSGVGKVNAARTTQILIDKYKVNKVINVGAAASKNASGAMQTLSSILCALAGAALSALSLSQVFDIKHRALLSKYDAQPEK